MSVAPRGVRGALWLLALALTLAAAGGSAALPQYNELDAQETERVRACWSDAADPKVVARIVTVCDAAGEAWEKLVVDWPDRVRVYVSPNTFGQANVVTDRESRLFVTYLPTPHGTSLGQWRHMYGNGQSSGPLLILAQAVGELYNVHRVPGLNRWVAGRQVLPALVKEHGKAAWDRTYPQDDGDNPAGFAARCAAGLNLTLHPDYAAVHALDAVVEKLSVDWLAAWLLDNKADGKAAFEALRVAAVAAEPALAEAFKPWQQATARRPAADGSLLLSSFETVKDFECLTLRNGIERTQGGEWATDGDHCVKLTFQPGVAWPWWAVEEDDWRFHDWTGYSTLEFDLHNPGDRAVTLIVRAFDACDRGHGTIFNGYTVPPGEDVHAVLRLAPGDGESQWPASVYWDGRFRLAEVGSFVLCMVGPLERPTELWVDNLRLVP